MEIPEPSTAVATPVHGKFVLLEESGEIAMAERSNHCGVSWKQMYREQPDCQRTALIAVHDNILAPRGASVS
jgi:hypothetical protein